MCHASCSLYGKRQKIPGTEFFNGNFVQILVIFIFYTTAVTQITLKIAISTEFYYNHQRLCKVNRKQYSVEASFYVHMSEALDAKKQGVK